MPEETPNFLTCPAVPELPSGAPAPSLPVPRRRYGRWIVLFIAVLVLVLLAPLVYGLAQAGIAAWQLRQEVASVQAHAQAGDFSAVSDDVQSMQDQTVAILDGLQATGGWRSFPAIGQQIVSLEDAARAGQIALGGAQDLVTAVRSMQDALAAEGVVAPSLETGIAPSRSFRDLSPDEKRSILARFDQDLPEFEMARDKIHLAREAWDRVPADALFAPIRQALAPVAILLPSFETRLTNAINLAQVLLPLSGYPQAKTYLALLQNADELRPTGGFIGTVGVIHVDAGDFQSIKFQDVYAIDGPAAGKLADVPPAPLRRELGVDAWYLRDSNWSPDFPTSAERIMDVYNRERILGGGSATPLSGVIALQPGFFRDLLTLTGPITVQGKTFSADNFFTELEYDVEVGFLANGTPVAQRKEVLAALGDALITKLMSLPSAQWPGLVDLTTNALDHKDILLYDRDPKTLSLLDAHDWTGRAQPTPQDYLWVVDANLAALKTDGVMDKQVDYSLDTTDPAGPVATVVLHYHNTNRTFTWRYTRYRDYVRVYVPDGSQLLSSSGAMLDDIMKTHGIVVPGTVDVTHELGKTVFGAFWSIEPGETRDLTFRYRLPATVAPTSDGMYHLLVQKEPGSNTQLTLDLLFGKNLASAEPPEAPSEFGDARYRAALPLDRDRTIDVTLSP